VSWNEHGSLMAWNPFVSRRFFFLYSKGYYEEAFFKLDQNTS